MSGLGAAFAEAVVTAQISSGSISSQSVFHSANLAPICYFGRYSDIVKTIGSLMEGYIALEYPKWVDGIVVHNAAEEQALRGAAEGHGGTQRH